MAEHHTHGREGQGARRRHRNRKSYGSRHRMPRPEEPKKSSTSFVAKVLKFLGFGKNKGNDGNKPQKNNNQQGESRPKPPQKVRVAKPRNNNKGGNPAAAPKKDKARRERKLNNKPVQNGRVYVGNLSFEATESEIEDLFKGFGDVRKVEIVYNSHTFKSKGFGFVEMRHQEDAQRAVDVLHGQPFMGRELLVRAANERPSEGEKPAEPKQEAAAGQSAPAETPAPEPAPAEPAPVLEVNFAPESGVSAEVTEPPAEQQ